MAKEQAKVTVKPPRRVFPLPEAIPGHKGAAKQPERWRVRESGQTVPRTEIERGEMVVPLGDDAISECVRAHETGHARWSPSRPPAGLAWDVVQAVEDMRVHSLLASNKVDMTAGLVEPAKLAEEIGKLCAAPGGPDRRMLTLMRVAAMRTGSAAVVEGAIVDAHCAAVGAGEMRAKSIGTAYDESQALAAAADRMLHAERAKPRFEDTKRVAEWLETMLADAEGAKEKEREEAAKPKPGRMTAEERGEVDRMKRAGRPAPGDRPRAPGNVWGAMRVERVPLTQPLPPRHGHKRVRPQAEGDLPRRLERWCVDQAVFTATKRMRRGTVLIDQSGSMRMTAEDVCAILDVAPAARVAGYAGSGDKGTLRIIADRGRRCADHLTKVSGGGNVIDGPALRWLARQPGPRVWVCDGVVTGVGDRGAPNLYYGAAAICRAAGIVRVPTVELAVKLMAERARA
jgi:hypothetical protein